MLQLQAPNSSKQPERDLQETNTGRQAGGRDRSWEPAEEMAAKGATEMEVGGDGVAVITICNPPVNALHPISERRPSSPPFLLRRASFLLA